MIYLTCFSIDVNRLHHSDFSIFSAIKKQGLFWLTTIALVLILLYRALFDYSAEREPEIEEEEPEFFVVINSTPKRNSKK